MELTESNVNSWRNNWKKRTSEKLLSIPATTTDVDEIIKEAILRAYAPSIQNTYLKSGKYGSEKLQSVKETCISIMENELKELYDKRENITADAFAKWEKDLADKIRNKYHEKGVALYTYGNAQK